MDFKFQLFDTVVTMVPWSRVSVQGIIHETDEVEASSKHPDKSYMDFSIRDQHNKGLKIRVVAFDKEIPKVETGRKVMVRNAKINSAGETIFADLDDMCSVDIVEKIMSEKSFIPESCQQMQLVRWPVRRDI